jgi:hypothetical protein
MCFILRLFFFVYFLLKIKPWDGGPPLPGAQPPAQAWLGPAAQMGVGC